MLLKVRIKLLVDQITNLFKKKRPKPKFSGQLYQLRPQPIQKSMKTVAGAVLRDFIRECGMIVWGDLKWVMSRRKQSPEDAWASAVEQLQKAQK